MSSGDRNFQTRILGRAQGPTLRLCDPARIGTGTPELVDDWGGSATLISGMTVPNDATQILLVFTVSAEVADTDPVYDPDASSGVNTTYPLTKLTEMTIAGNQTMQVWSLLAPEASNGANGSVNVTATSTAFLFHAVLLKNVDQTTPLRAHETTTAVANSSSISNAVASLASDYVISFLGFIGVDGSLTDPIPGGSQTSIFVKPAWRGPGDAGAGVGLSYQVGASQTDSWTVQNADADDNFGLGQLDLMFGGEASSNPLNGTSSQAARCDKSEHEILPRDPTVNDDANHGYPRRTIWHNSSSGATFISTDGSTGAAVWADLGGLSEAEVQALIDDSIDIHEALSDPHPGYVKESLFAAAGDTLVGTGSGTLAKRKNNDAATAAPTTGDDSGDGYAVGSRWIDTTNDHEYVCVDATAAAAVWVQTDGGGAALAVEEVDASPTDSAVTKIKFPNGTLSITSHEVTYTPLGPMINTDADPGTKIYVGLTDPDGVYTLAEGDVWIDRNP
jgi:hypothetical protein